MGIREMTSRHRQRWTGEEIAILREAYPNVSTKEVAERLGRGLRAVYERALALGIRKSAAYMASGVAGRLDGIRGQGTRFKSGMTPWNKGMRFIAGGRSSETRFKKGRKPHTWNPIGHERISKDGYLQRKMSDTGVTRRDYVNVHHLVWREAGFEIPPGHMVCFRDGNKTNITLCNLELISRRENMSRNSVHNLPKEVVEVMQLRGALNRKINRIKEAQDEQRDDC